MSANSHEIRTEPSQKRNQKEDSNMNLLKFFDSPLWVFVECFIGPYLIAYGDEKLPPSVFAWKIIGVLMVVHAVLTVISWMLKTSRGVEIQVPPEAIEPYNDAVEKGYTGSLSEFINEAVKAFMEMKSR